MRLLGAALILCASGYAGFSASRSMDARVRFWEEMLSALEILRAEICFAHSDIRRAFIAAAAAGCAQLFEGAARNIERMGLEAAWKAALIGCALPENDKETLRLMAAGLGKTDESGQKRHLEYMTSRAIQMRDEAKNELIKKGALIRRGAILAGLFTAIVLM